MAPIGRMRKFCQKMTVSGKSAISQATAGEWYEESLEESLLPAAAILWQDPLREWNAEVEFYVYVYTTTIWASHQTLSALLMIPKVKLKTVFISLSRPGWQFCVNCFHPNASPLFFSNFKQPVLLNSYSIWNSLWVFLAIGMKVSCKRKQAEQSGCKLTQQVCSITHLNQTFEKKVFSKWETQILSLINVCFYRGVLIRRTPLYIVEKAAGQRQPLFIFQRNWNE